MTHSTRPNSGSFQSTDNKEQGDLEGAGHQRGLGSVHRGRLAWTCSLNMVEKGRKEIQGRDEEAECWVWVGNPGKTSPADSTLRGGRDVPL